jgi:chemotaxis family two-component system sensor kinase Cph1
MPSENAEYSFITDADPDWGSGPGWTENAELRQEVERLRGELAAVCEAKASVEAFAALAAHELLEPLVLTEAYAALIGDRLDDGEHADTQADLEALSRSARRSRLLVETLLYNARSRGDQLDRRSLDLDAIVHDCLAVLKPENEASGAAIQADPLPSVRGDEPMVAGVYRNLLLNALKYSPRNGSRIHIGAEDGELFVESDGQPIPEEDRERIFEPFNRGRGERRARGTGLGLAICRDVVERHGGRIGVRPRTPSGNRFWFTLPA